LFVNKNQSSHRFITSSIKNTIHTYSQTDGIKDSSLKKTQLLKSALVN